MTKISPKAKTIALSAVAASTAAVAYASNEVSKKDSEQSVDTANLIVEKIGKDRVKLSIDNVENAVKAFQLSLKIEGNVKFNDNYIKWLTTIDNKDGKNADKPVETDYILSNDKKEIDIFVASNSELYRNGRILEICEINLKQTGLKSNSSYKIVPNTKDQKVAYKSIDTNNNQVEEANMAFDNTELSLNTAPTISLKELVNDDVTVDAVNNIIKVKEGYDFNTNAKSFVEVNDEDEEISLENVTVTTVDIKKTGTYDVEYTVKDSDNETTKLDAKVLVEPEVWKDAPTLTGVPDKAIEIYTGDVFNPLMPDGETEITAKDVRDNVLDVEFTQDFDLEQEGEYTITYTAKDRYNNTVSKDMTLNVVQNEAPKIIGAEDIVINKGTEFDPKEGIEVEDSDSDVTISELKISGNFNINVPGKYTLTYEISDGKNTTKKVRKVIVNDAPSIHGDLSYIILKNGQELNDNDILGRIEVSDDLDENITAKLDKSELKISEDGIYKVKIIATDSKGLTTEKEVDVIVTSKSVVELPGSGDGLSKEDSIKKQVVEVSAISKINEELSELTKEYDVECSKTTVLEDTVYSIKVSTKPVAIIDDKEEWFVDIKVPKEINDSTGGIVITQHQAVKVSSIKINGYSTPLEVGDTIKLTTEINPEDAENKELIWAFNKDYIKLTTSNDGQSATIKAVAEGISKVRAMAADGSEVHAEILVQVGEKKAEDTQKPEIIYNGKKDIKIANGMKFKVPTVTATDNVDVFTEVTTTILNSKDEVIKEIDTTVAGEYKIKYTTQDSAGNEAELIITVTVDESIIGVTVGKGDATTEGSALEINSDTVSGLNKLIDNIKRDKYEPEIVGKPVIDTNSDTATYTIKLSKKQGLIARLFNLNKNTEAYYIKVTVKNEPEFTGILDELDKNDSTTNPPSGGGNGGGTSTPATTVTKLMGNDRYETAAKVSKEGWSTSADTVIIVNGDDKYLVDGLTATPLASVKNAPILLSNSKALPKFTIDEIKRLSPKNVIVIGGENAIPQSIIDEIEKINSSISVERIGGADRYETSLNIAKEIDKTNNITKIYVGAGNGEADSLSIASVAGREKSPIILSQKDGLTKSVYDYIKSEKVVDGHIIGGPNSISDSAIAQIDSAISNDISGNRISGSDRKETNAKVIEKFYTNNQLNGVIVAKENDLVDALTVGPLGAKEDMPVVLATNEVNKMQENILGKKKSPKVYEIGGGIKPTVIEKVKTLVNNRK